MFDAETAFERAFENDQNALQEIRNIVSQLESSESLAQQRARLGWEALQKLQELARAGDANAIQILHKVIQALEAQKYQQQASQAAAQKGEERADVWLQNQVEAGARIQEALKTEQESARQAEETEAAKRVFKLAALAELEARAALWRNASEAAEIRLQEAEQSARYAKLKLEGLSALPAPMQPSMPGLGIDDMPTLPPVSDEAKAPAVVIPIPELYALLEVGVDATFDEIKRGYRRQALQWHPDKNRENLGVATERFQRINEAFEVLFDPEKRSAYDSGNVQVQGRIRKLQGHGWSQFMDEDDSVLTPSGMKFRRLSWQRYVMGYSRMDDDVELMKQLIKDDTDPRAAIEKIRLFWRYMAEEAYKNKSSDKHYLNKFIRKVWKDTPTTWPGGLELQNMGEAARQEWKERRMVFNRRKEKLLMNLELHEDYLNMPGREEWEREQQARCSQQ